MPLSVFMGKNTPERQDYIVQNLRVEMDILPEEWEQLETDEKNEKASLAALAPF